MSPRIRSKATERLRILCVWLPNWSLQRRIMQQPELARQAIAVHAQTPRRGRRILQCSPESQRMGLRVGMPLSEAASLRRRRGAALQLLPHDVEMDTAQLAELAAYCERFSPLTGWRTTDDTNMSPEAGPDCLLMNVTNLAPHFGGESGLVRRIVETLKRRRLEGRVAVADTVGAAWAAAKFLAPPEETESAEHVERILPPDNLQPLLALPPVALRIPDKTIELLSQLGIETIQQLVSLPRDGLAARLGERLLTRWDQARGAAMEAIVAHRTPIEFSEEKRFEAPTDDRRILRRVISDMVAMLARQLRLARRGASELACRLDALDGESTSLAVGLFEPSIDVEHLSSLMLLQLDSARIGHGVERIELRASRVAPLAQRQGRLFPESPSDPAVPPRLAAIPAQLVDRLRQRLGNQHVVQAELRADAQPERAFSYTTKSLGTSQRRRPSNTRKSQNSNQPMHDPSAENLSSATSLPSPISPLHRPLLLCQPKELTVFSWRDELPHEISWDNRLVEVLRHWGPERIETGWWRGKSVRRDYYRVELRGGERLWIFCQLNSHTWYLHGWS